MNEKDLARILRDAWGVHRLDAIRGIVQHTIEGLHAIEPQHLLNREPTPSEALEGGPVDAALAACCDELRDGCGLTDSPAYPAYASPTGARAASWADDYSNALDRYRESAGKSLEASLGMLVLAARS